MTSYGTGWRLSYLADPKQFFRGCKGKKAGDVDLFQDNEYLYAIRDNTLVTVLCFPGKDMVTDFLLSNR
jgi:hypothetical protein